MSHCKLLYYAYLNTIVNLLVSVTSVLLPSDPSLVCRYMFTIQQLSKQTFSEHNMVNLIVMESKKLQMIIKR